MSDIEYTLYDGDNEIVYESSDFDEIKTAMIEHIIENMWDCDKFTLLDNTYGEFEIAGETYSAYNIVDRLGDMEDALTHVLGNEFAYMEVPDVGEIVEIEEYGGYITAEHVLVYELNRVYVRDGLPLTNNTTYGDVDSFDNDIAKYVRDGWIMAGKRYQDDQFVRVCLMSTQ